jgi:hypothetical protein
LAHVKLDALLALPPVYFAHSENGQSGRESDRACRGELGCDQVFRRDALFHPIGDWRHQIDRIGAGASATVIDAGQAIQANVVPAFVVNDIPEAIDKSHRVRSRNKCVLATGPDDQLATVPNIVGDAEGAARRNWTKYPSHEAFLTHKSISLDFLLKENLTVELNG